MSTPPKPRIPLPVTAPAALAILVLLALLAGCSRPPGAGAGSGLPRRVFLITVDTLRADHLTPYGYPRDTSPAVADLARRGVLFEHAETQWPKTGPSFASMFTGQYPQSTGLTHDAAQRVPDAYLTLPELMKSQGFTTAAVVSNGVLSKDLGWDHGFDEYLQTWTLDPHPTDDPVDYRHYLNAARVNELAEPLLERHKDDRRLFVWLHYSDPHAPYLLPADVANPFVDDDHYTGDAVVKLGDHPGAALGSHRELRYYVAAYDGNVRFADQHIGRILALARQLGLLDDALVVFTADHGESLGEHDYYFGHGRLPYEPCAHVPLIVSWPGHVEGGRRVSAPVELVDLYPTLRDLAAPGAQVPGLEGHGLGPLLFGGEHAGSAAADDPFQYAFSEAGGGSPTTHFRTVRDLRWKLVFHPPLRKAPPRWELYDLQADPGETRNLADRETRQLQRLRSVLGRWMKGNDWIRKPKQAVAAHGEETEKALKALGYVQ